MRCHFFHPLHQHQFHFHNIFRLQRCSDLLGADLLLFYEQTEHDSLEYTKILVENRIKNISKF